MPHQSEIQVINTSEIHVHHAGKVAALIRKAAEAPGAALAIREEEYLKGKIKEGKAVIALTKDDRAVGFCYIEAWEGERYVANSGLVVDPEFRGQGLAFQLKVKITDLSQKLYPNAKFFGLTTSQAVMSINSKLGYVPVAFQELTTDDKFWKGCETCKFYDVLQRTKRTNCLCTAMLKT